MAGSARSLRAATYLALALACTLYRAPCAAGDSKVKVIYSEDLKSRPGYDAIRGFDQREQESQKRQPLVGGMSKPIYCLSADEAKHIFVNWRNKHALAFPKEEVHRRGRNFIEIIKACHNPAEAPAPQGGGVSGSSSDVAEGGSSPACPGAGQAHYIFEHWRHAYAMRTEEARRRGKEFIEILKSCEGGHEPEPSVPSTQPPDSTDSLPRSAPTSSDTAAPTAALQAPTQATPTPDAEGTTTTIEGSPMDTAGESSALEAGAQNEGSGESADGSAPESEVSRGGAPGSDSHAPPPPHPDAPETAFPPNPPVFLEPEDNPECRLGAAEEGEEEATAAEPFQFCGGATDPGTAPKDNANRVRFTQAARCPTLPRKLAALREEERARGSEGPLWERTWPGCTTPLPDHMVHSGVVSGGEDQLAQVLRKLLAGEHVYIWNPGLSVTMGEGASERVYEGAPYLNATANNCTSEGWLDDHREEAKRQNMTGEGSMPERWRMDKDGNFPRCLSSNINGYSCLILQWFNMAFPCQVTYFIGFGGAGPADTLYDCLDVPAWTGMPRVDLVIHEASINAINAQGAEHFYRRLFQAYPSVAVVQLFTVLYYPNGQGRLYTPSQFLFYEQPCLLEEPHDTEIERKGTLVLTGDPDMPDFKARMARVCDNGLPMSHACYHGLWQLAFHYNLTTLASGRAFLGEGSLLREHLHAGRLHFHPMSCEGFVEDKWNPYVYAEPPLSVLREFFSEEHYPVRDGDGRVEAHPGDYGYGMVASFFISFMRRELRKLAAASHPSPAGTPAKGYFSKVDSTPGLFDGIVASDEQMRLSQCLKAEDLQATAKESWGWKVVVDHTTSGRARTPGLKATEKGATIEWIIDGFSRVAVVSYLQSYANFGTAGVACSGGCRCPAVVINGTDPDRTTSEPEQLAIGLSQDSEGAECTVRLVNLEDRQFKLMDINIIDSHNQSRLRRLKDEQKFFSLESA